MLTTKLYDEDKRGAKAPNYTEAAIVYRNKILSSLQNSYMIRESSHLEYNDMTYMENFLYNRQSDMAYNPPKLNNSDVRVVAGTIHEKDTTFEALVGGLNFVPRVGVYNTKDEELLDFAEICTAILKKSLIKDNFKSKVPEFVRVNTSQGDVFIEEKLTIEKKVKKTIRSKNKKTDKQEWVTSYDEEIYPCSTILPNTSVFLSNIYEKDLHKQERIFAVFHLPTTKVSQMFSDFDMWCSVPKSFSQTVPINVDGVYGDFWLLKPAEDFMEVIITQSEVNNDYNVFVNGTMMYPVEESSGVISGYPLTNISPSGKYNIVKGINELIPFFAYGKSVPSKNWFKEELTNEWLRLMVYKGRQAAKPPIANNSDRVLPRNIFDPGVVTPNISMKNGDFELLTPNAGITAADFQFFSLINQSISETSISNTVQGSNNQKGVTATQYLDQKKQELAKNSPLIERTKDFLREIFWLRLYNEVSRLNDEYKSNTVDGELEEFVVENIDGTKTKISFVPEDVTSTLSPEDLQYKMLAEEENTGVRSYFANKKKLRELIRDLKDIIYIDVIVEPEDNKETKVAVLFNLLTQYANLRSAGNPMIKWEYLEKAIADSEDINPQNLFIGEKELSQKISEQQVPAQQNIAPQQNQVLAQGNI